MVTNYARELVYITEEPTYRKHRGSPSILKYFNRIRSFTLVFNDYYGSTTGKEISSSLKTSLSRFIRANHLIHLRLYGIKNLPATFFLQVPYLSKLVLEHCTIAEVVHIRKVEAKPPKLRSFSSHNGRLMPLLNAKTANGTSILDLTALEEFSMGFDDVSTNDGMDLVRGFLKSSTELKSLKLSGKLVDAFLGLTADFFHDVLGLYPKLNCLGNLADALTADNLKTLKILHFYPMLETNTIDPYLYLVHELEVISGKNVLQALILEIDVDTDCHCTTDHDTWSKLDCVLSQKGAFPFIRQVRMLITLNRFSLDYVNLVEKLEEVGRVCFPWLRENEDVEFTFEVRIEEI